MTEKRTIKISLLIYAFMSFFRQGNDILNKIEDKKLSLDKLREMDAKELGFLLQSRHWTKRFAQKTSPLNLIPRAYRLA